MAVREVFAYLCVDDADRAIAFYEKAFGATVETPPTDMFYGERMAVLRDPFGHRWNIGHTIEQVAPDEMQRRYNELV